MNKNATVGQPNKTSDLKTALLEADKRVVTIGDTLRIWMGTADEIESLKPTIEAEIKRALARGDTVTENGTSRWVEESEVRDSSKTASDAYTWSKDGNSIKVEKAMVIKQANGNLRRESIGFGWRKWS